MKYEDVVERSEYKELLKENERLRGDLEFKSEALNSIGQIHKEYISKINKAIEEIEKSYEPIVGTYNGDTPEFDRPLSRFNRNEGKKQALEILKRNIGE